MSSAETHDEFIHHIAIKLSRALNIVNPNDLLAQRVTDIAKTNTLPAFISGKAVTFTLPLVEF
jgi:pre-mRNA-splicing factor ATP-dependent RNA helicase DHX38/PRP16